MREWFRNYILISFIFMMVSYLAPREKYREYYRFITGLILTLLLLLPLINIYDKEKLTIDFGSWEQVEKKIDAISYEEGQNGFEEILNKKLGSWKNKKE